MNRDKQTGGFLLLRGRSIMIYLPAETLDFCTISLKMGWLMKWAKLAQYDSEKQNAPVQTLFPQSPPQRCS